MTPDRSALAERIEMILSEPIPEFGVTLTPTFLRTIAEALRAEQGSGEAVAWGEVREAKNGHLQIFAPSYNVMLAVFTTGGDSGLESGTKLYTHAQPELRAARGFEDEPIAWRIDYKHAGGTVKQLCHHNAVGDYRTLDPDAVSIPLYRPIDAHLSPGSADERRKGGEKAR